MFRSITRCSRRCTAEFKGHAQTAAYRAHRASASGTWRWVKIFASAVTYEPVDMAGDASPNYIVGEQVYRRIARAIH